MKIVAHGRPCTAANFRPSGCRPFHRSHLPPRCWQVRRRVNESWRSCAGGQAGLRTRISRQSPDPAAHLISICEVPGLPVPPEIERSA
jgi:hypothetical protein